MPDVKDVTELEFLQLGEEAPDNNDITDESSNEVVEDNDIDDTENEQDIDDVPDEQEDNTEQIDQSGQEDQNETSDDINNENEELEQEEEQESLFQNIISNSGLEFEDDELNQILDIEESEEGLNQVADIIANKKAEKRFSSLLEENPHTARMLQYEMNGGDPDKYYDTYFPDTNYQELEIAEDDVQTQKQVVAKNLELQGLEQEDIDAELNDLEDAGILERRAKRSLKALQKHQQKQVEEFEQEQQQLVEQRQQEAQQNYNQAVEIIDQGDLNGIKIPKTKADEFKKYLFEPVDESGVTQAEKDAQSLGLEQRMLMAYLNFSGNNLDDFINSQSKNKSKRSLRESIKKSNSKENLKGKGNQPKEKPGNPDDIVSPFM